MAATPPSSPQALCLTCALCCNGALFRDVELQPHDDPARLRALGLPLRRTREKLRLPQPCAALTGRRCQCYADRPAYCRAFDCALLQAVAAGRLTHAQAARHIRRTHRRLAAVLASLRALGETDETLPLARRCQRILRHYEQATTTPAPAALATLTLAWHDLNRELAAYFHPGTALAPAPFDSEREMT